MTAAHPPTAEARPISPRRNPLRSWGLLLGWAFLTLYLVVPPREAMTPDLDSSNHGTYSWMLVTHKSFGSDVVPMTGPYGFLFYGITYAGYLFHARLIGDLLLKAVFAFIVFRLFARTENGSARWLWLTAIFVFLPNVDDLFYDVGIFFSGLLLLLATTDRPRVPDYVALLLLGFLSLLKGNHFVLSAVTVAAVMIRGTLLRQPAWIVRPAVGWIATVLFFWTAAGQSLGDLPSYLHGIQELASGYNNAMGYDETFFWFVAGLSVCAGLGLTLLTEAAIDRNWRRLPLLFFLAGFAFVKWKHGYVRADGHIFIFFFMVTLLLPSVWLAVDRAARAKATRGLRVLAASVGGATFLLTVAAASDFWGQRFLGLFRDMPGYMLRNISYLRSPSGWKERLDGQLAQNRLTFDLPQIRNEIGQATVDFFGFEQGILLLNGLNYHPRPMGGGSFNVYTRDLQRLNEGFVRDPKRRPAYQVVKLRTLDDRFPAADDPLTLETLLHHYSPVLIQREFLLMKDRGPEPAAPHPTRLAAHTIRPGESLPLPNPGADKMLLFTVHRSSSFKGALRSLLYRPSSLQMEVKTDVGERSFTYRLIPELVSVPVILSPLLEDNLDLVNLYGHDPGRKATHLILHPQDPTMFKEEFRVTLFTLPRPPPPVDTDVQEIITYMKHPLHNRTPSSVSTEETGIRELNKEPISLVHAPGHIAYPLEPDDQQLIFSYGLMPQTYDPGQTDGVEFLVEAVLPAGNVMPLFQQYLQPVTNPAHRGMHRTRVYLPPRLPAGSVLRLRTETGPSRNGAWDQSYITRLQIKKGLPDPRQYFGFNVPPLSPGYAPGSEHTFEGRPVRGVHPPTELTYPLPAGASRLVATFGILPGAYTDGNKTDGVGFTLLVRRPDGTTETVLHRLLDPLNRSEDRGLQNMAVSLPVLPAGSTLLFRADAGPHENLSWDWAVLQTLFIE